MRNMRNMRNSEYRGFRFEAFEGTTARPTTLASALRGDITGGSKRVRGVIVHLPDGGTKFVTSEKKAREYVDNYLGEE